MADIYQDMPVKAPIGEVFAAISAPGGLDTWWTQRARGVPREGAEYELGFGPQCLWQARVTRCVANSEFELTLTRADADWTGTKVRFALERRDTLTLLHFSHTGWPDTNEHFRVSTHCWAMYLRILRRSLEHGESVPYEERLEA